LPGDDTVCSIQPEQSKISGQKDGIDVINESNLYQSGSISEDPPHPIFFDPSPVKRTKCSDELEDVVSIAAEAADEASIIHQTESEKSEKYAPQLDGSPRFDLSPSTPCPFSLDNIGTGPFKYALAVSSIFAVPPQITPLRYMLPDSNCKIFSASQSTCTSVVPYTTSESRPELIPENCLQKEVPFSLSNIETPDPMDSAVTPHNNGDPWLVFF